MDIVLNKHEYEIMNCISGNSGKFSASEIQKMLLDAAGYKIGEASVRDFLNRLARKKMIKKYYVRIRFFKWRTYYQSCHDKEFLQDHLEDMYTSGRKDVIERDAAKRRRKLAHNPFVIAEPVYYSTEEKDKIQKMIDELQ